MGYEQGWIHIRKIKIFLLEEKNNQTNLDEYYFKQKRFHFHLKRIISPLKTIIKIDLDFHFSLLKVTLYMC